ncbi:hypothetical protein LR48_Vigan07g201000 [Vigna angularis]|uniref:Exocyst subunit Exo70 family protein n=1 Tax=Phaseolus angularis TaxID=3914 RepID=A0A0L9V026_PHAAN|nr:hypothetical protein LR48_Vigan07g201000 [Vigna angularis]
MTWHVEYANGKHLHIPYHHPSVSPAAAVRQPSSSVDLSSHEFILALLALVTIPVLIYIFIFAFDCPSHRRSHSIPPPRASFNSIQVVVQTLFHGEKSLYDYVFGSTERKIVDSCFAAICKDGATTLFGFPENVSKCKKMTEKMLRMLDLYNTICENQQQIEYVFSSESTSSIILQVCASKVRLGEAIRTMLIHFEFAIHKESSKIPMLGARNNLRFALGKLWFGERFGNLDLSHNAGKISNNVVELQKLNVSYNHLYGHIPKIMFPTSASPVAMPLREVIISCRRCRRRFCLLMRYIPVGLTSFEADFSRGFSAKCNRMGKNACSFTCTESEIEQNVPPAILLRFLREHRSEWADNNIDAYSAAAIKAGPCSLPGARPGGGFGGQLEVAAVKVVGGCSSVSVSGWHQGRRALFLIVEGALTGQRNLSLVHEWHRGRAATVTVATQRQTAQWFPNP